MNLRNPNIMHLIVSTVLALGAGAGAFGLQNAIKADAQIVLAGAKEAAYRQATEQERRTIVRLMTDTEAERSRLATAVLTEDSIIDFIADIEQLARERSLEFTTQAITAVITNDPMFDELKLDFQFTGSEEDVVYIIRALESVPHDSRVDQVSVFSSRGELVANVSIIVTILEND